jgi:hypothetical protein
VAKRAVRPELRFAQLRRLRITGKRILVLSAKSHRRRGARNQHAARKEKPYAPPLRPKLTSPEIRSRHAHFFAVPPWIGNVGLSSDCVSFE